MFDFLGSKADQDKRRELEENIAQIRKKVQQEERQRRAEDGNEQEMPQEPRPAEPREDAEADRGPGGEPEPRPPERMTDDDSPSPQEPPAAQPREDSRSTEPDRPQTVRQPDESSVQERRNEQSQSERQSTASRAQDTARSQRNEMPRPEPETEDTQKDRSRMSFDDVPQPPEVKDLDIPDIDKGPLFITVNKFKNALTTLSEMKNLVSDLESHVGSLENTLEEDRETEDALRKILDTTISDTEIIQDTVSPKK